MEAMETKDERNKVTTFKKEYSKYTPLMLAVASDDKNLDCVKLLLKSGANFKAKDANGNSLLHIAALHSNNKILNYITKNVKLDIFERNEDGETALNICTTQKNSDGVKALEELMNEYDGSKGVADELLKKLEEEKNNEGLEAEKRK